VTLNEEKKLVAEKLMGWKVNPEYPSLYKEKDSISFPLEGWNPQSERKWWDEIWDKMDERKIFDAYLNLILGNEDGHMDYRTDWDAIAICHTAKPEVRWPALIKTLKEIKR